VLRPGDRVLDVGAWPGAWMQVALERVGRGGRVVGVDVVEPQPLAGAAVVVGDIRQPEVLDAAVERLGGKATVVLCDIAPKLTGVTERDEAMMTQLVTAVADALPRLLDPGGRLVLKLFSGEGHVEITRRLRPLFGRLHSTRPRATRPGSSEIYVIGLGFRPLCG